MLLWLLLALMTGAAILAVLWPLSRGRERLAGSADVAVYRDQLAEIERDRARGLIAGTEAEGARIEVSRRLIAAADAGENGSPQGALGRRRAPSLLALIGIPVIAGILYVSFGSPDLPGAPLAARLDKPPELQDVGVLLRRVEAHLKQNPDDGRGWEVVAPVYASLGRHEEAANARSEALRLLGPSADREADYGEALVAVARGGIDQEARAAFERAVKLDLAHAKGLFFLGLAAVQEGRRDDALRIWREVAALGGGGNPRQSAASPARHGASAARNAPPRPPACVDRHGARRARARGGTGAVGAPRIHRLLRDPERARGETRRAGQAAAHRRPGGGGKRCPRRHRQPLRGHRRRQEPAGDVPRGAARSFPREAGRGGRRHPRRQRHLPRRHGARQA